MPEDQPPRTCGFRFFATDLAFLVVCSVAAFAMRDVLGALVWIIPFVVLHFFLFCNVFRVRRSHELAWAGAFLVNALAWQLLASFSWLGVLAVQLPLSAVVIVVEMRSPSYHGVWARRLNPRLDEWLAG
jgi:hypothetical protein